MTLTYSLTTLAIAIALVNGTAVARPVQAQPIQTQSCVTQGACQDDARTHSDRHDDARNGQDQRYRDSQRSQHKSHGVRANSVLLVVRNSSLPHDAAYGWQYFSDPQAVHAAVISPSGEYFLSLGDGPKQITGPTGKVLVALSAQN